MNRVIALLVMGGALVTPAPLLVHLAFAILGIGVVGMVHGAGDLAVVAKPRRPAFLAAYGLISLATLFWWIREPAVALPAFLVASAIHFGVEDAPCGPLAERIARGVTLVLGPAALHHIGYADLLRLAGGSSSSLTELTPLAAITGGLSGATLLLLACHRRDALLAMGVGALLLFPHWSASRSASWCFTPYRRLVIAAIASGAPAQPPTSRRSHQSLLPQ
ncbi:Brp/Blh family beta-carotene 15,15'-dioxygenase [Sphingomonas sp. I4]